MEEYSFPYLAKSNQENTINNQIGLHSFENNLFYIIMQNKNIKNNNNDINQIKSRNNYINNINIIIRKNIISILIIFITKNIFYQIKPNIIINSYNFKSSKITLKTKGIGESNILGNEEIKKFQNINYLKEIKINGKIQDEIKYNYHFNKTDNCVELIWPDDLDNCDNMFYQCSNITEINLSHFNTSNITSMYCMLDGCSSMTSIDLSNIDTSQVTHIAGMFYNCQSLTSLNLSFLIHLWFNICIICFIIVSL